MFKSMHSFSMKSTFQKALNIAGMHGFHFLCQKSAYLLIQFSMSILKDPPIPGTHGNVKNLKHNWKFPGKLSRALGADRLRQVNLHFSLKQFPFAWCSLINKHRDAKALCIEKDFPSCTENILKCRNLFSYFHYFGNEDKKRTL